MKKLLLLAGISLIISGCTKTTGISFCEYVSKEGKGINCGKKFSDGDLVAVIKSKEPFGSNKINIRIDQIKNDKRIRIETLSLEVEPDRQNANPILSFYRQGKYLVTARVGDRKIGEGNIEIVEK